MTKPNKGDQQMRDSKPKIASVLKNQTAAYDEGYRFADQYPNCFSITDKYLFNPIYSTRWWQGWRDGVDANNKRYVRTIRRNQITIGVLFALFVISQLCLWALVFKTC